MVFRHGVYGCFLQVRIISMFRHSDFQSLFGHSDVGGAAYFAFHAIDHFRLVVFRDRVLRSAVDIANRVGCLTADVEIVLVQHFFQSFRQAGHVCCWDEFLLLIVFLVFSVVKSVDSFLDDVGYKFVWVAVV